MPSEYSLNGTGWNQSDFVGRGPSASEFDVPCDNCDNETSADDMDGWSVNTDLDTYETTTLCPECATTDTDKEINQ